MTWLPEDRSNCGVKSSSTGFITCGDKTFSSVACAILAGITELVASTANAVIDGRNFPDVTIIGALTNSGERHGVGFSRTQYPLASKSRHCGVQTTGTDAERLSF